MDLDLSQDFGIEVVGGDFTEIIISDDVSEVRCCPGLPYDLTSPLRYITKPCLDMKPLTAQP